MEFEVDGKKVLIQEPTGEQEEEYIKKTIDIFKNGTNYDYMLSMIHHKHKLLSELTGIPIEKIKKQPAINIKKAINEIQSRFNFIQSDELEKEQKN